MKTSAPSIEKIGFKVGFITFLSLVAYFMIMKFFGLSHILELRFFNFVILTFGICYGIYKYKRELQESDFYMKGWGQGMFISVVSIVLFALFMSLYLSYFDEPLMQHIRDTTTLGFTVASGFHVFFAIFMEGMASAVVITLAAMQYFKSVGKV
ncbi:MAG: DUF4199 domain-containing protein [Bacteroidota bacterium]